MGSDLTRPEVLIPVAAIVLAIAVIVVVWLSRRRRGRAASAGIPIRAAAAERPTTLRESLTKTREGFLGRLQSAWGAGTDTEARLLHLEEVLITADVGVKATQELIAKLRPRARELADAEAQIGRAHV